MDEIFVEKLTVKEGAKDGRPWKRTAVKDAIGGEWFSTFDENLAGKLAEGKRFRVEYESKPLNGRVLRDLKAVEAVEENGASVPEQYSHQRPDGEADWDKVALGKTRCALWMNYLAGQLAAGLYVKASQVEGRDPIDHVVITGVRLVVAAERDIFERPPGDDGIPFDFDQGAPR